MNVEQLFKEIDEKFEDAVRRFSGNQALLTRFVKLFPSDMNFEELRDAIAEKDYPSIEIKAHTLKGVAANLGFQKLSDKNADIVNAVRKGSCETIEDDFKELSKEYMKIREYIEQLD